MNNEKPASPIQFADLDWIDNQPQSKQYQDLYFSKEDGLAESDYVFIGGNKLVKRLASHSGSFTIAESGFGTGLNFFSALKAWDASSSSAQLNFVSIEKHPLTKEQIRRALSRWPELSKDLATLLEQYPEPIKGAHRLSFREGKVDLTLIFGDVNDDYDDYRFSADAWLLDGFNPAQNTAMWSQSFFDFMSRRSNPDASFATFTAAGFVKRGLTQAGFKVEKQKGFGRKREMLIGRIDRSESAKNNGAHHTESTKMPNWAFCQTSNSRTTVKNDVFDAAILGAGIAGLNTAHTLADKGLKVALIDRHENALCGASGQEQLIMYSKLPSIWNREARLITQFLCHAQHYYATLQRRYPEEQFWEVSGQLQLAWNDKEQQKNLKRVKNLKLPESFIRLVEAHEASQLAQTPLTKGGLWFPNNGVLKTDKFAKALCRHPNIQTVFGFEATAIEQNHLSAAPTDKTKAGNSPNDAPAWSLKSESHSLRAHKLVITSAYDSLKFGDLVDLPLKTIRGQSSTTFLKGKATPKCVLCGEGYLCPSPQDTQHFGASYDLQNKNLEASHEEHLGNLEKLKAWLPEWHEEQLLTADYQARTGFRCTTPDYFPIIGPAHVPGLTGIGVNDKQTKASTVPTNRASNYASKNTANYAVSNIPDLYLNLGHGSKGLVSSALGASHISALITNSPTVLNVEQAMMLHPARFDVRKAQKRQAN